MALTCTEQQLNPLKGFYEGLKGRDFAFAYLAFDTEVPECFSVYVYLMSDPVVAAAQIPRFSHEGLQFQYLVLSALFFLFASLQFCSLRKGQWFDVLFCKNFHRTTRRLSYSSKECQMGV